MMRRHIPGALILTRFFAGPALLWAALSGLRPVWLVLILVFVFLSDVFDGMIARRLKVVTAKLRVADSWADTLFHGCVALAIWLLYPALLTPFIFPLGIVLSLMITNWVVAMLKFHHSLSFHAYSSKLWGIILFAAGVSILGFSYAGLFLWLVVIVGVLGHLEGLVMTLILPYWVYDVSGIPKAIELRTDWKNRQ